MAKAAADVLKAGDTLFGKKENIDSLFQEIALNFYPERADFTTTRNEGEEYADHLFTSYPVLARRELGNLLAAGLRPRSQRWFSIHVDNAALDATDENRKFLEHLTNIQWRATYENRANFVRATKQADHDFAAFGNAVIKMGLNLDGSGLLYTNYHLRDCAWSENAEGRVDNLHRNWKPTARQIEQQFPNTVSEDVKKAVTKDPEKIIECRHAVMPARMYPFKNKIGRKFPYVSVYIERGTETVLEEIGLNYFCYVVPRWQTVSGSQYGMSMATAVLLPDGRTVQAVVRTLREAGEKYADPPMIAISEAIRGDMALYAGGVTTADMEYDERLGDVLRPITQNSSGMPIGFDIAIALKEDIRSGFFLDKIQLPESSTEMTAFEVRRRIEEHIRASAPIYEPVEEDYSNPMCELGFDVLRDAGAFPLEEMPESLQGADIRFSFRSPLADLADRADAETYMDVMQRIVMPAAQIDPAQMANVDMTQATRDAMRAGGWKATWFNPPEAVTERQQQMAEQAAQEEMTQGLSEGGAVAEQLGKGIDALEKPEG